MNIVPGNGNRDLTILGGGGHAKVVISVARLAGFNPIRVLDDNQANWGSELLGVPVTGPINQCSEFNASAVIAIGSNRVRQTIATQFPHIEWATLIHPSAWLDSSVQISEGSVVFAGSVIQPDSIIGRHCIVNTMSSVDHDCTLQDFAQIAPGAHLGGNVYVGEGAMVGIGASVHQGSTIGAWSILGGGAFLKGKLTEGKTAVGIPAKIIK